MWKILLNRQTQHRILVHPHRHRTHLSQVQNLQSSINNRQYPLPWPATLPDQVAAIQKLLPTLGPDPETLAAAFGKRSLPRIAKVAEILETLRTLGRL